MATRKTKTNKWAAVARIVPEAGGRRSLVVGENTGAVRVVVGPLVADGGGEAVPPLLVDDEADG